MKTRIPKVPPSHWLLKNFNKLANDPIGFMEKCCKEYGDVVNLNISPWVDVILVTRPEIVKHVLVDNQKTYKKSFSYKFLKYALGNGLLTNEGNSWLSQRRIAQPAFHKDRLASLASGMKGNIEKFIAKWKDDQQRGTKFDIASDLMKLTCDIASKALFSSDLGDLKDKITKHITVVNQFIMGTISTPFRIPLWIPIKENSTFNKTLKELDEIIFNIIETRRNSKENYLDLLSMLMSSMDEETGEQMNDKQLRDEIMTLFLAGSETSANALAWMIYLLIKYPEVKKTLYEEVKKELGEELPSSENIGRLKYTNMVIHETMRLYPPAWVIAREAKKKDIVDGHLIERRAQIYINLFLIHRNPVFWEDPDKFNPLRFTLEQIKIRNKFSYLPFGAGPRFCIGNNFAIMEITIAIALIALNKFEFKLESENVELDPLVTLRPKGGLWVSIKKDEML